MIANDNEGNQRWLHGVDSRRPAGEPIRTSEYEVVETTSDNLASEFVETHHYSGTFPSARYRFCLYRGGELVGMAVYSHPSRDAVLTNVFPQIPVAQLAELGRFVLLENVPGNGETWFLGKTFEMLQGRVVGVVSFSDPMKYVDDDGRIVSPGHYGTIYQAHNGRYRGLSSPQTLRLFPDGTILDNRAMSKIRKGRGESGFDYASSRLRRYGADEPWDDTRAWLAYWRERLTRPVRHHGKHRYAWILNRRYRKHLPPATGLYPKRRDLERAT
jgi:hypothetical protein